MTPPDPELNLDVALGKFACAGCCFDDEHLKNFVTDKSVPNGICSYCRAKPAMPVDVLFEAIKDCLSREWLDPGVYALHGKVPDLGSHVPDIPDGVSPGFDYGGYFTGYHLPEEVGLCSHNDEFCDDFREAFADTQWSRSSHSPWFPAKEAILRFEEWSRFRRIVMHERRYFFASGRTELGGMLFQIGASAHSIGLFRAVNAEEALYRVRVGEFKDELEMLAPPPEKSVFPNRMSPAGVPMFYGAFDADTAIRETCGQRKDFRGDTAVTIARFHPKRALVVLDLTEFPEVPSPFAPNGPEHRLAISFLRMFAKDAAKPVDKDGGQHIEYVPTQIFTEFLREFGGQDHRFPKVDGIVYASAKNAGGKACVLFPDVRDDGRDMNLRFDGVSWRKKTMRGKWVKCENSPK